MTRLEEVALTTLLSHRLTDGSVYLEGRDDRVLLKQAIRRGLVDEEGYLTTSGKRFLEKRAYIPPVDPKRGADDAA